MIYCDYKARFYLPWKWLSVFCFGKWVLWFEKKMAATSQVLGLCLSSAVLLLLAPETVSALPPVIRVGKSIYPNNKFSSLYFSFTRDPERFKFLYSALNFVMAMETTFQSQIYHCVSFALKFNTLRTGSFKLFKRLLPGFLTILTL